MLRIRGAKRSEAEYIRENEGEKTKKRHRVFSVVTDTKPFERDWRGNKCLAHRYITGDRVGLFAFASSTATYLCVQTFVNDFEQL